MILQRGGLQRHKPIAYNKILMLLKDKPNVYDFIKSDRQTLCNKELKTPQYPILHIYQENYW